MFDSQQRWSMIERTFPAWAALRATDTLHMSVERSMFLHCILPRLLMTIWAADHQATCPVTGHTVFRVSRNIKPFHMNGRNLFPMFPELFPIFNLSIFFSSHAPATGDSSMPPHLATFRDDLQELKAYGEGLLVELQCQHQQALQSRQVARMLRETADRMVLVLRTKDEDCDDLYDVASIGAMSKTQEALPRRCLSVYVQHEQVAAAPVSVQEAQQMSCAELEETVIHLWKERAGIRESGHIFPRGDVSQRLSCSFVRSLVSQPRDCLKRVCGIMWCLVAQPFQRCTGELCFWSVVGKVWCQRT